MDFYGYRQVKASFSEICKFKCAQLLQVANEVRVSAKTSGQLLIECDAVDRYADHLGIDMEMMPIQKISKDPMVEIVTVRDVREFSSKISKIAGRAHTMKQPITTYATKHLTHSCRVACIDVEMFERNQTKVLEIGFAHSTRNGPVHTQHFIVEEHLKYRNRKYVPDNRQYFQYGDSVTTSLKEIIDYITLYLNDTDLLIGHGISNDVQVLNQLGIKVHIPTQDTCTLGQELMNIKQRRGLIYWLTQYGIDSEYHHNGGNDAHRNLMLYPLMVRDVLELREKRKREQLEFNQKQEQVA